MRLAEFEPVTLGSWDHEAYTQPLCHNSCPSCSSDAYWTSNWVFEATSSNQKNFEEKKFVIVS